MQEAGGLDVDLRLETGLRGRGRGKIADAGGGDGVLGEGICEAFADFGGFGQLGGGWWFVGVSVRMS